MKNCKGSHVGFVISFVMFITFVVFIYVLLESRTDFGQNKQNSLEYVKSEIIERVSENMTITSLNVNSPVPSNTCFHFVGFGDKISTGSKIMVQNDSGSIFTADLSADKKDFYINRGSDIDSTFFKIYSAEDFPSVTETGMSSCADLSEGAGYTIGLSKEEDYTFESKVLWLLNNYTTNYKALKKDIKISPGDEFGFAFIYNNGTEIKTPRINATINIYSERIPVQYIKTDSKRETGFIDVVVW
ncbi:MAG: hypothetical protein NTW17_03445 [Candidatus Pacearchaeota archaeon]|nr:hypothetical protein [Candidatus Pacearchaeota archaeon]